MEGRAYHALLYARLEIQERLVDLQTVPIRFPNP